MSTEITFPTRFYTDVFGAELRNPRWSWGAHDPVKGRIYLRVWEDEGVEDGGTSFAMVLRNAGRPSLGRAERQRHLALVTYLIRDRIRGAEEEAES